MVSLCTEPDCSDECRALGLSLGPTHYCVGYHDAYHDVWIGVGDGECDDNCNNWQCGHDAGDCSLDEQIDSCMRGHRTGMAHIKSRPANSSQTNVTIGSNDTEALALVEVELTDMEPLTITLNQDTSVWYVNLETNLRLRWRDSRLRTVACRDVLSDLIDLRSHDQAAERAIKEERKTLIWFPRIQLGGKDVVYLQDAVTKESPTKEASFSFTMGDGGPWMAYTPTNTTQQVEAELHGGCFDCADFSLNAAVEFKLQPTPTFEFYPFDEQQFDVRVTIADAHIFTCASIINVHEMGGIGALVPTTNEFIAQGLDMFHPKRPDGRLDRSTCVMRLRVRRNPVIFTLKQILPSMLVTMSGLCSLLLDAVDHTGDRTATILVAALILVVNFQTDLELGSITYITWWDAFNLTCLALLAVVLGESLYEHILCQTHRRGKCIQINRVSRVVLPLGFAPLVLIWIMLVGQSSDWSDPAAWSLLVVGNACVFCFGAFFFSRINSHTNQKREKVRAQLEGCDPRSDHLPSRLQAAFHAYDLDGSGTLDMDEARELVQVILNGRCKPIAFAEAMLNMRSFGDADGHLTLPSLADAITHTLGQLGLIDDNDPGASSFEFSKGATASDLSTPAQAAAVVDTSIDPPRGTNEGVPSLHVEVREGSTRRRHRQNGTESGVTSAKTDSAMASKVRVRRAVKGQCAEEHASRGGSTGNGRHRHHNHRHAGHEA